MEERLQGISDGRLRPRLLRLLLRDIIPDEKRGLPLLSSLDHALSIVKHHSLLSERPTSMDPKVADAWSAAVDDWVARLLSLVESKQADKCWMGICLLGVTCKECSPERFLASYYIWFQKLLLNLQPLSSSNFVRVVSCASLADLLTRLSCFSGVKKEGVSISGKLVQPVLQLLNEDVSISVLEGAVDLLCTLITYFPSSLHRYYDNVEAIIVSRILSGKYCENVYKKFASCLSSLPKVKACKDSWFSMMQKIMILINRLLTDAFTGLEDESRASAALKILALPGKDPISPLGGHLVSDEASQSIVKNLRDLLTPRLSALMHCCCLMLSNSYPVQVNVPIQALLAVIERVLLVDGSLNQKSLHMTTSLHQELVCSVVPALHLKSLDLLEAIIRGAKSQLLPYGTNIVQLLAEYFSGASGPFIRIKIYSIMQILLSSMGIGMALYLDQLVIKNTSADLDDHSRAYTVTRDASHLKSAEALVVQSSQKKGKQSSQKKRKNSSRALQEQSIGLEPRVGGIWSRILITPLSVKIAALRTLDSLLTVGGAFLTAQLRANMDNLIFTVATNTSHTGWDNMSSIDIVTEEPASSREDFQVAAFQALLASLLSPSYVRPPYLSQGQELFRKGMKETGSQVSTFCAHASLALEVLIHPRGLPWTDVPVTEISSFNDEYQSSHKGNNLFSKQSIGAEDLDNCEIYHRWLGSNNVPTEDAINQDNHRRDLKQFTPVNVPVHEDHVPANTNGGHQIVEESHGYTPHLDVEMTSMDAQHSMDGRNSTDDPNLIGGFITADSAPVREGSGMSNHLGDPTGQKVESGRIFGPLNGGASMGKDAGQNISSSSLVTDVGKRMKLSHEYSDSSDSLPDIIDGDPDSDSLSDNIDSDPDSLNGEIRNIEASKQHLYTS